MFLEKAQNCKEYHKQWLLVKDPGGRVTARLSLGASLKSPTRDTEGAR